MGSYKSLIKDLREQFASNNANGYVGVVSQQVVEKLLDHIEQIQTPIGKAVIVPEYPFQFFHKNKDAMVRYNGIIEGIRWARENAYANPDYQLLQPDMVGVDRGVIEFAIQWYHAVQDLNPAFLDPEDVAANDRIKPFRSQAGEVKD